tara:strand:- start:631 stop:963 length:333 start_codon:yes stop_codon:yes gene_type:complete
MRKDEQLDAMSFAIENIVDDLITSLDSDDDLVIEKFLGKLNYHINHYLEEFDINLYEAVGILEDIKYTMLLEGEIVPTAIGCLEAQKIALLTDDVVTFECDADEEDDFLG